MGEKLSMNDLYEFSFLIFFFLYIVCEKLSESSCINA